jgi:hypothetical protein
MFISPTNRLCLGLDFLHGSSGGSDFGGQWSLVVFERCVEHKADILCRGFSIDEVLFVVSLALVLDSSACLSLLVLPTTLVETPASLPKTWSPEAEDC